MARNRTGIRCSFSYVSFVCHVPAFKVFISGLQADPFFAITTVFVIGSCRTQPSFLKWHLRRRYQHLVVFDFRVFFSHCFPLHSCQTMDTRAYATYSNLHARGHFSAVIPARRVEELGFQWGRHILRTLLEAVLAFPLFGLMGLWISHIRIAAVVCVCVDYCPLKKLFRAH